MSEAFTECPGENSLPFFNQAVTVTVTRRFQRKVASEDLLSIETPGAFMAGLERQRSLVVVLLRWARSAYNGLETVLFLLCVQDQRELL